jgi:hypothetical protein
MTSLRTEARDNSPDAARFERVSLDVAVGTLGSVLRAELRSRSDGGLRSNGDLRRAIRALCAAAHQEHLHAEQMLVFVKKALSSLPEVAALPAGPQHDDALAPVISLCIEEFYADEQ